MADEDEVDVLGDFSLDNLLSKNGTGIASYYDNSVLSSQHSELSSYEYSLNSQWLLENPTSNTDCWYTGTSNDFIEDGNSTNTSLGFDEVICTENKTTDESGWTDEEKSSLVKGLEIFGKNITNLSQFIGSKTPSQVKYYLKNYYVKTANKNSSFGNIYNSGEDNNKQSTSSTSTDVPQIFQMSDIIEDAQIPASIEEVIAAVSTASPTVPSINRKTMNTKRKIANLKTAIIKKPKKTQSLLNKLQNKHAFRSNWCLKYQKTQEKKHNKPEVKEIQTTVAKTIPVDVGEVIKLKKETDSDESDIEIDIDIDEDDVKKEDIKNENVNSVTENLNIKEEEEELEDATATSNKSSDQVKSVVSKEIDKVKTIDDLINRRLKTVNESVLEFLKSNEMPKKECILEENVITDVEKCINSEFFEGRPTKTPDRYLKIRNHIIDYWLENKPQYCTKTAVRQGLKNCGDVNCIGRIHQYLEQIGAINFACAQTNYIRPLINLIAFSVQPKEKPIVQLTPQKMENVRPRMKKKYNNDGEGGCTIVHDENGEIIDTTVINEDKQVKTRTRRGNIKLLYCKGFTDENPAPFSVVLHLNALLLIDMHAHSALIEVMGLLGGYFDHSNKVLHITHYKPCLGIDHSNTHCDMCPVSQSEASEALHSEGLEVIGWFHSHPTFYPNPSLQDVATQLNMQTYLSNKYKPFVGVILSPFRALATALVSEYRCLIVNENELNKDTVGVPYKFQTTLDSSEFHVNLFLKNAHEMFAAKTNIPDGYIVNFTKSYFQDSSITYLEKLLSSVKLHLARCTDINKMTCDAIVSGITEICLTANNSIYY